ncbi:hypothetical protein FOXYS1_16018, partial [Fusarium oxysporum]
MKSIFSTGAVALLASTGFVNAQSPYSIASTADIKKSAKQLAADLITYYHGNDPGGIPGILPGPPPNGDYYWWEG